MTTENKEIAVKQAYDIVTTYCQKFKEVPIAQALISEGKGKLVEKILANFYFICRKNGNAANQWDKTSVIEALTKCCQWELVPDGVFACLVPYRDNDKKIIELTFQPMYQGLLEKAYSTGIFKSISANVVYDGDEFDYNLGGQCFVTHKLNLKTPRKDRLAVYVDMMLANGGRIVKVMTIAEVKAIEGRAKNKKIWPVYWDGMAIKTVIKQGWKLCPKSEALAELIAYDNSLEQSFEVKPIDTSKADNLNQILSGNAPGPEESQYLDHDATEKTVQIVNTINVPMEGLKTADQIEALHSNSKQ